MQSPQPQNRLTEITILAIVILLIVSGVFLLYVGKIDFSGLLTVFGFAGGALGINGALKAPSPAQSAQLQTLFSQVMTVLPGLFSQLQPPQVTVHNNIPAQPSTGTPVAPVPVRPPQFQVPAFTAPQAALSSQQAPAQPPIQQ